MQIGGLQKLTLIDYPEKLACTVFLAGCNFRCPWCYAPELVLPEEIGKNPKIEKKELFDFLRKRKGKLEGVVICGGEPTLHEELSSFIKEVKEEGFLIKLDTNGSRPEVLKKLIEKKLVDYVAMDVKTPLCDYEKAAASDFDTEKIKESIRLLLEGKTDYEFRTTVVPGIHGKEEIKKMGEEIKGAKRYFLQNFLPDKTIDESFLSLRPFSKEEMEELRVVAEKFVKMCKTR